jgi:hypothetical protein
VSKQGRVCPGDIPTAWTGGRLLWLPRLTPFAALAMGSLPKQPRVADFWAGGPVDSDAVRAPLLTAGEPVASLRFSGAQRSWSMETNVTSQCWAN